MIRLKSDKDIAMLCKSGLILGALLKELKSLARVGLALRDLDIHARDFLASCAATPAFLGYRPEGTRKAYPAAICTSLNEVVVHGLPSSRVLKDGDLLKIDAGVSYEGYITDAAVTVPIGKVSASAHKLIASAEEALKAGIKSVKLGGHIGDIGYAIERVAKKHGMKVIRGLTGHGVGFALHEDPVIYNYGEKGTGIEIVPGMVLAIEPMFSISSQSIIQQSDDSYATADGSLSVHFEHTIAITKEGTEILTKY